MGESEPLRSNAVARTTSMDAGPDTPDRMSSRSIFGSNH